MDDADAASRFTEYLILEILTRLPAKSLHRFKCVCRQWLALISNPDHGAKMPQTLASFFYIGYNVVNNEHPVKSLHFTSAGEDQPPLIDPSALSVPPPFHEHLYRIHASNGLLLLRFWLPPDLHHRYAVCNPITDEWAVVPESSTRGYACFVHLAVVPAVASASPLHFRVFEFRAGDDDTCRIVSLEIYSSELGTWTHRECGWDAGVSMRDETSGVFFNGMYHMAPLEPVIASIDGDGSTWKTSPKPSDPYDDGCLGGPAPGFIGVSEGRLRFLNTLEYSYHKLCSWELDDDGVWVLKHTINLRRLFAERRRLNMDIQFRIIGIHPHSSNIVYYLQLGKNNNVLISLAMDDSNKEDRVIRELGYTNFGPYVPYVPRFSVTLAITGHED
jgi:hypothetical protein